MYQNDEREARYRSYKRQSTACVILTIFVGFALLGMSMSYGISLPLYVGAVVGGLLGGLMVNLHASDEGYRAYWDAQSRADFEAEERHLVQAWERERNRPDDEYVGW